MHRLAFAAILLVASRPSAGHADEPALAFGLDYGFGQGGSIEAFDLRWRFEGGVFARLGHWQLAFTLPVHPWVHSSNVQRDSGSLTAFGLDTTLAYRLPIGDHGVTWFAAGIERMYLWSDTAVTRTCRETLHCLAGFSTETPSYHAWVPELRIGVGPAGRTSDNFVAAIGFEIIVDAVHLVDVPSDGVRGIAVIGALNLNFGGGPGSNSNEFR